jgi:hypothetical protein
MKDPFYECATREERAQIISQREPYGIKLQEINPTKAHLGRWTAYRTRSGGPWHIKYNHNRWLISETLPMLMLILVEAIDEDLGGRNIGKPVQSYKDPAFFQQAGNKYDPSGGNGNETISIRHIPGTGRGNRLPSETFFGKTTTSDELYGE